MWKKFERSETAVCDLVDGFVCLFVSKDNKTGKFIAKVNGEELEQKFETLEKAKLGCYGVLTKKLNILQDQVNMLINGEVR